MLVFVGKAVKEFTDEFFEENVEEFVKIMRMLEVRIQEVDVSK